MNQVTGLCTALCALSLFAGLSATFAQTPAAQPAAVKRALLIGINNYKSVPELQGSINDVESMREILMTRWGFQARNITLLTDENATRAAIVTALNTLVQIAGPADSVYFHYSGHGSQVQDLNGDEPEGLDETIVPQDGRTAGVRDIVDDELDAIFSRLRARSAVIVLDSCHSGTATRAMTIRTRSVPRDDRLELYRNGGAAVSTRAIVPFRKSRFVVMGGAAANEEALDGEVDGRYHGFFSYSLARALTSSGGSASPRQVLAGVARELGRIQANYGRSSMPEPQLEAPPEALDQPLFAAASTTGMDAAPAQAPRLAWVVTMPTAANQVLLLNAALLGAAPGSTWAIYPPGETRFAPGAASAVARVIELTGRDARAAVSSQTGPIPTQSRAVIFLPAPASTRVAIRILDVPADQRVRIADVLKRNIKNLTLVGPAEPARFLVDMQGAVVRLLTADGLRVLGTFAANDERAAANVARIASRSAGATELLSLDNPMSQLQIGLRVAGADSPASRDIAKVGSTAAVQLHARRDGEARNPQNSLQLSISVSANSYLTIIDVDSEGNMNVLFPNDYQKPDFYPDGAVRAGQSILIPDSLQTGNRAGFHWDYSPPSGTDTVRVFASTDVATAARIRDRIRGLQNGANQNAGGTATRGIGDAVESLRSDLTGSATRGIKVTADSAPADWAATSLTIEVSD
jgi:hypothetical protein